MTIKELIALYARRIVDDVTGLEGSNVRERQLTIVETYLTTLRVELAAAEREESRNQVGSAQDAPLGRFVVFAGDRYYAGGGWRDFLGSYPTLEAAEEAIASALPQREWWHVVDTLLCCVVKKGKFAGGYW